MTTPLFSRRVSSPVGELTLIASDRGLRAVLWPEDEQRVRFPTTPTEVAHHPVLDAAASQLDEYFGGQRTEFDLDLDLEGTDFQLAVWRSLATIPFGQTASYSEQADRLGRPTAVRAVAAANGRNPVSIVLPCHRVVGKDGSLTGFAGGLEAKRYLLDHERCARDTAPTSRR